MGAATEGAGGFGTSPTSPGASWALLRGSTSQASPTPSACSRSTSTPICRRKPSPHASRRNSFAWASAPLRRRNRRRCSGRHWSSCANFAHTQIATCLQTLVEAAGGRVQGKMSQNQVQFPLASMGCRQDREPPLALRLHQAEVPNSKGHQCRYHRLP
jgi:hypothetical protein